MANHVLLDNITHKDLRIRTQYGAAYGDNVTNSRYLTQVQYSNFGIGSNWSKPTTFGGEIGFKF